MQGRHSVKKPRHGRQPAGTMNEACSQLEHVVVHGGEMHDRNS